MARLQPLIFVICLVLLPVVWLQIICCTGCGTIT